MAGASLTEPIEEAAERIKQWEPDTGGDWESLAGVGDAFRQFRDAFTQKAGTLREHEGSEAVADSLEEAASSFDGVADMFDEVYQRHLVYHGPDAPQGRPWAQG